MGAWRSRGNSFWRRVLTAAAVITVMAAGGSAAGASSQTEETKLTASDAARGDVFGWSVAVSGDTIVVGANGDDDNGAESGSAYVFARSGSTWSEQAKLIASDGEAGDFFGWSAAISGDTVVVGANRDDANGINSGSAYVFERSGSTWSEQAKLTASDAAQSDKFAWSVAISGDTVLAGSVLDSDHGTYSGSAYVFTRSGSTWSEQAKLTASDAAADDRFGRSVAVSGDTVVVGARLDDDHGLQSGSAYVFTRSGSTWSEQAKLTASDAAASSWFGGAVAISGDAIVVGARLVSSAYVFTRSGSTWTEQAKLTASDAPVPDATSGSNDFGWSVAVSGDVVVVGATGDDDNGSSSGSAYVWDIGAQAALAVDRVAVTTRWSHVDFPTPFAEAPIVVAGPTSWVGRDPVTIRVRNVSRSGFDIRLTEWAYLDGRHTVETVSYLALPPGRHLLPSGAVVEAGTINVSPTGSSVSFLLPFAEPPVLLSTVVAVPSGPGQTARSNVTASGFSARLDTEEAQSGSPGGMMNWVAWSSGSDDGDSDHLAWETHKKAIDNSFAQFRFGRAYVRPCVLADMNTIRGGDTANLRYRKLRVRSVRLRIDEERSADAEVAHTAERVGLLVVECAKNPPRLEIDFEFGDTLPGSPTRLSGSVFDDAPVKRVSVAIKHRGTGDWLQLDGTFGPAMRRFDAVITERSSLGAPDLWVHEAALPDGEYSLSVAVWDSDGNRVALAPWRHFTVR